ncbi:hypothetical protein G6F59_015104 [Rhizopus arrhizus]|nr:hypothetical protein G6F59_015104 [Rhizopus arrhizus]
MRCAGCACAMAGAASALEMHTASSGSRVACTPVENARATSARLIFMYPITAPSCFATTGLTGPPCAMRVTRTGNRSGSASTKLAGASVAA